MKAWQAFLIIFSMLLTASALITPKRRSSEATERLVSYFGQQSAVFSAYTLSLGKAVSQINAKQPATVLRARLALTRCRIAYKKIEFFLEYFFQSEGLVFNSPPKYEAEEPYMEYQEPVGMQVMEAYLFDPHINKYKSALMRQSELISRSAADLPSLLQHFQATDAQVLESARLELIRVMTLSITGYDAPLLKTGIPEAHASLCAIREIITPYLTPADSVCFYLDGAIKYLQMPGDFNSFNRLFFLTTHALPLQRKLNKLSKTAGLHLNTVMPINPDADDLFSPGAFNKAAFQKIDASDTLTTNLGRQLFFDKDLSGNRTRSCATCHSPATYFTDGLKQNTSLNDSAVLLQRNTPGLLYACYQYAQFWDGRAASLAAQVKIVLANKQEMGAADNTIMSRLKQDSAYKTFLNKAGTGGFTIDHIADALAAYLCTLTPFNSSFDKYMEGDRSKLTTAQQRGFNLFMGKAQCGTCHFAPLFNGLTPPLYSKTEYEVLGTPSDDRPVKPLPDTDMGRYLFFPIFFYKQAFKTPTVRNAAKTGPYMHNGSFHSLQNVIEFYNRGGGKGEGLVAAGQTLQAMPLNLSKREKADLVVFIQALTDAGL